MVFGSDANAVQQHGGIGFRLPAVHLGKFGLQLAGTDTVLVGEILLGVDGVFFLHDLVQAFVAHDNGIHYHIIVVFKVILFQHGETLAGGDDNVALCGLQLAGKNFQKGGFSGSVCSDQTVAVALGKFNVDILK